MGLPPMGILLENSRGAAEVYVKEPFREVRSQLPRSWLCGQVVCEMKPNFDKLPNYASSKLEASSRIPRLAYHWNHKVKKTWTVQTPDVPLSLPAHRAV
jgi:hypothetical protein